MRILKVLEEESDLIGKPPAQVALNWLAGRPGVTSIILGATKIEQFRENFAAATLELPADARAQLDAVSDLEILSPYEFFTDPHRSLFRGNFHLEPWTPAAVYG